jgi:hypothetical protein
MVDCWVVTPKRCSTAVSAIVIKIITAAMRSEACQGALEVPGQKLSGPFVCRRFRYS